MVPLSTEIRLWDEKFNRWQKEGFPLNDEMCQMPGTHPVAKHKWNTDKSAHLSEMGLKNVDQILGKEPLGYDSY